MNKIFECLTTQNKISAREIELITEQAEKKEITPEQMQEMTGIPKDFIIDYMQNKKTAYNRIMTDLKLIARIGIPSRKYYIKDNNLYISGFDAIIISEV